MEPKKLILPLSIITPSDLNLVLNEINSLAEFILQESLKNKSSEVKLPRVSKSLDNLASLNNLDLTKKADVDYLESQINDLQKKSPIIHVGFAVEPNILLLEKLSDWFRKNIDNYILLTIGLQPNIGAGITLRTTNKFFDLSVKNHFKQYIPQLVQFIKEAS